MRIKIKNGDISISIRKKSILFARAKKVKGMNF